ncbi:MAG: hypothetical protein EOO37_05815 [Cytophagaceae bacterium]|nr:MAG: hypothetical protein EOO37_05815 [Cytophagaceae bacterium]
MGVLLLGYAVVYIASGFFSTDFFSGILPCIFLLPVMVYNPKFGPAAQTPEQRAWVLAQMQRMIPDLKTKATTYIQHLYARYVAGELSWAQVCEARDAAPPTSCPAL